MWSPQIQKGVCRLLTYSGYFYGLFSFQIHDSHVLWLLTPQHSFIKTSPMSKSYNPHLKSGFGLLPFRSSLTQGISYVFFSSGYLDISVPQVPFLQIHEGSARMNMRGLPHSDTAGSLLRDSFPTTIVVLHVLLRHIMPRHPLPALI